MAWRRPSAPERRAITRVAKTARHAEPQKPLHVSDIRVSTVGPWALATLTLYLGHVADKAMVIEHNVHGRWTLTAHSPGTSGVQCGIDMPHKDQRNLGLGSC